MTTAEKPLTGAEDVRWDLSDYYTAPDDPQIEADMATVDRMATDFAEKFRGQVASLDDESLYEAVDAYEQINIATTKLGVYAYLIWTTDTANPQLGQLQSKVQEFGQGIEQKTMFFRLEWIAAPEDIAALTDHPTLEKYSHVLKLWRLHEPYTLSEPEEKVISKLSLTGLSAWNRFYGEVMSQKTYDYRGEALNQSAILNLMRDPDREVRRDAADALTAGLRDMTHTTTFVFNMMLQEKAALDEMRGYATWVSSRNVANQVDDETVEALVEAVTSRYDLVHRYYRLLKTQLGYDELFDYDRYAPVGKTEEFVSWADAHEIVLNAYGEFDPQLANIVDEFFQKSWIDAPPQLGKRGGAYSMPGATTVHPHIFMNYQGNVDSVMTLAHELGHGIHQYLARGVGELNAGTPLTTAEMASTFGESLTFDYLMARTDDPKIRFERRMARIVDTFGTVYRQISMNRFEHAIHTERRSKGELTTDRLSELWYETQTPMYGDTVTLREDYALWWSYIPHFIHTPGYVYAYSFGELLVWALYARYKGGQTGFQAAYKEVLAKGGSDYPHNLLKPLGIDLQDPAFWHDGLNLIDAFITETEADAEKL